MNKIILIIVGFFISVTLSAQKISGGWKKSPEDKKECRKFSNNIYLSAGLTPFLSIYNYRYKYAYEDGNNLIETFSEPQKSFAKIEMEGNIRYNIFNYRDFFSVSTTYSPALSLHEQGVGTICWNNPLSVDLNFFNHSTFNNINNLGFSISGGLQSHKFKAELHRPSAIYYDVKWRDFYGRFTIKFRKYKSTESIKFNPKKYYYSYFALQYSVSNQTTSLNTGESITDKFTHAKIVFGKIFRY